MGTAVCNIVQDGGEGVKQKRKEGEEESFRAGKTLL